MQCDLSFNRIILTDVLRVDCMGAWIEAVAETKRLNPTCSLSLVSWFTLRITHGVVNSIVLGSLPGFRYWFCDLLF